MSSYGFQDDKTKSVLTIEQMILDSQNTSRAYTDQAKNETKSYANAQANNALNSSKTYTDRSVNNSASSLRSDLTRQIDSARSSAVAESKAYTDNVGRQKQNSLAGGTVPNGANLNEVIITGFYWLTNHNYINSPFSGTGYGFLEVMVPNPSTNEHILQRITQTDNSFVPSAVYVRTWIADVSSWSSWIRTW